MKAVQFTGDGRKPIRAAETSLRPVIGDTPGLVPGTAANGTAVEIKDPKQNSGGQRKKQIRSRRYGSKQDELTDGAAHD